MKQSQAAIKQGNRGEPRYWGFLYGDDEEDTRTAEKLLSENGVRVKKFSLIHNPQPGMNFVDPTFITREGTFRGLRMISAYLDWFVNDPDYQKSQARA